MPCLGFMKSWPSTCSKVSRLLGSTTSIFFNKSLADESRKD
jgi:hypothetical protein